MDADEFEIHLGGPARLALVDAVLDALDAAWTDAPGVPDEDRTLFTLAVSEVVTNMVQHGEGPTAVTVRAEIRLESGVLTATLIDTAPPASIDWHGISMPDENSESGRGLALSQSVLDEFTHTFDDTGNTWRLTRRIGESA
jgi:serine/threonine-protein kinase RsbW